MQETLTNCPRCPKACPSMDLQCCKGRHFFKETTNHHHSSFWNDTEQTDELSLLFDKCIHHMAHHRHKGHGQKRILKLLDKHGALTQKELQEAFDIQSGSMSELVSKLESKGFITKERDEHDKRKVVLHITEEGRQKANSEPKCKHRKKSVSELLTEEEQATLKSLLQKILHSWES